MHEYGNPKRAYSHEKHVNIQQKQNIKFWCRKYKEKKLCEIKNEVMNKLS